MYFAIIADGPWGVIGVGLGEPQKVEFCWRQRMGIFFFNGNEMMLCSILLYTI